MKTITEHLNWGKEKLDQHHIADANLSAKILLSFVTGLSKVDLILKASDPIPKDQSIRFQELIQKRCEDYPIAYLIGEREFYGRSFLVNEHVLIPRPETEMLIEWFGKLYGGQAVKVCDVGTGSGTLAVTLKCEFPEIHVTAVDISLDALKTAQENAQKHCARIDFLQSDLLQEISGPYDVVVANLPYISTKDMETLSKAVQFEPRLALESGHDGLDHYRRLLPQALDKLRRGGGVFLEFGMGQTDELISLLSKTGFSSIEIRKDFSSIDRIVFAKKG